jgi:hypothetical protein
VDVLQVQVTVLRLDVFLLESCAFYSTLKQRGLFVSDTALPSGQLSLLVQKSAKCFSDYRIC